MHWIQSIKKKSEFFFWSKNGISVIHIVWRYELTAIQYIRINWNCFRQRNINELTANVEFSKEAYFLMHLKILYLSNKSEWIFYAIVWVNL